MESPEGFLHDSWAEDCRESEDYDSGIEIKEHKVCDVDNVVKVMDDQEYKCCIKVENEVYSQSSCNTPQNYLYQVRAQGGFLKDTSQEYFMPQNDLMRYNCQVRAQGGFTGGSQGYFMPQDGLMRYNCQVSSQGQCIKDASRAYFVTQDGQMKYNYQKYLPSPTLTSECCGCERCRYSSCKYSDWSKRKTKKDAEVQADPFESGESVLCIRCGDIIQDRSSCQERYSGPLHECKSCVNRAVRGPLVAPYLDSVARHNAAANTGTVPCCYCRKRFETNKGMKIHVGRIHKRAKPNH